MKVILDVSTKKNKKFMVTFEDGKVIHFGQKGASDFTMGHRDPKRKEQYIKRHRKRENWEASGIETAGWWSFHLLWELPKIDDAIHNIEDKFDVEIESNI